MVPAPMTVVTFVTVVALNGIMQSALCNRPSIRPSVTRVDCGTVKTGRIGDDYAIFTVQ